VKTLHLYLTRQVLLSLIMTVVVFTFVLLLGNVLKEIIALLVGRQITLPLVFKAIGLLIPYVMSYVLPFGMITSVLLVFGRFSADHELTAVRASGISLLSLVTPILLLGLLLSGICAAVNLWIAPQCRHAYKELIFDLGARTISNLISEDRFIDEIPGLVLYIGRKQENELEDVRLYTLKDNQITTRTSAKRGVIIYDEVAQTIQFKLFDAVNEIYYPRDLAAEEAFIGPPTRETRAEWYPIHWGEYTGDPIDLSAMLRSERKPKLSEMNLVELLNERHQLEARQISSLPVQVQINRQASFSFACFAFTLIGIPLAIQAHRRETSIGVAIALGLVLVYYSFMILADALKHNERLHPQLIMWLPNFVFEGLGAWLLYRANKE
jgi:lipopolysaccharide export system permease protein